MPEDTYTQCSLVNVDGAFQTAWIPTKYAKMGKILSIAGKVGWSVTGIYNTRESEYVLAHERDYRRFPSIIYD
jgi:hypothetical protein